MGTPLHDNTLERCHDEIYSHWPHVMSDDRLLQGRSVDSDGDGFVDEATSYTLTSDRGDIQVLDWQGRQLSNQTKSHWNAINAIEVEKGYKVLLQGAAKRDGQFRTWDVNASGRINGSSGWRSLSKALKDGWEDRFGDVIQPDGVIGPASDVDADGFLDGKKHYQIYLDGSSVSLRGSKGERLSDRSSKRWNALKAISTEDGFQVLLGSEGKRRNRFQIADVNQSGEIIAKTDWLKGAKALFAGWDTSFRSLLVGDGFGGGLEAASVGEDDKIGELIYQASVSDDSAVTFSFKESEDVFDRVLTIDRQTGEVRFNIEGLQEIPDTLVFTVVATDAAGNRSELPVKVGLTLRQSSNDLDENAVSDPDENVISALSVEEDQESDSDAASSDESTALPNDPVNSGEADSEPEQSSDAIGSGDSPTEDSPSEDSSSEDPPIDDSSGSDEKPLVSESETPIEEGGESTNPDPQTPGSGDESSTVGEDAPADSTTPDSPETAETPPTSGSTEESSSSGLSAPVLSSVFDTPTEGESSDQLVISNSTPSLSGKASAGSELELFAGENDLGRVTADEDGVWTFQVPDGNALADGAHSITVQRVSDSDASSAPSDALLLVVDTVAPQFTSESSVESTITVADGFLDRNGDGLVDDTNQSQILHDGAGIPITNKNGVNKGNSLNKLWGYQILKAIPTDKGYELLLKGTGSKHRNKFNIWQTDNKGLIASVGQWKTADYALHYGWEERFGDIIKPDGVITPPPRNTFFVSLDGDDKNPGTLEQPFKTIKMGVRRLAQTRNVPGGSLTIRGGTYRLPVGQKLLQPHNKEDSVISITGFHGLKDQPIRIQNYQDEEVIITGAHPVTTQWVKHDDNIWKTEINYLPSQLFLDGKMLTGARWPNITKDWDQPDDSNANNPTPDSYWHPNSYASRSSELPKVSLDGAVVVPHGPDGGNSISVIDKKAADSSSLTLTEPNQKLPSRYYLTNHLNLLDRPGEWHLEQRHSGKWINMSYGNKDYILKRKPSILYVWLPDGADPNERDIEARAFSPRPNLSAENNLLDVQISSNLVFDGLTFRVGEINFNGVNDTTISNSKLLYSGHHSHMLVDEATDHFRYGTGGYVNTHTNNIAYAADKGLARGFGFEKDRNLTIRDSEVAYTYGGSFLTWGKGVSGNTLDNVYFHNKPAGYSAFEIGRDSGNNHVRRVEYHTFGYGGIGRIGNQVWRTKQYGGGDANYPKSTIELSRIYNPFYHGDDSAFQVNQAQVYNLTLRNNWTHDMPGRNGIRFDGSPAGFGGTAHHNVSFNNRRGYRFKGDYHTILNNIAFRNTNNDVRVTADKFYGWRPGTNCAPTQKMKQNGEWFCKQTGAPIAGHANSIIHNNAGDKNSAIPVSNPENGTNNSMSKQGRNGSTMESELRDIDNYDFRPKQGSIFIDAGKHLPGFTDGFVGAAPDIGAYEYGDDHYWIPGYQTAKAKTPIPADGADNAKINADLIWLEGRHGVSSDIYFGSNPSDLQFQGNQSSNIFTPTVPLVAGQTYYWRIDTVTEQETIPGDVWTFTPVNPKAPEAPDAPLFDQTADTGVSSSDRITSINTPTFSGVGKAGQTIELFQNSIALGTTQIGVDGRWSYTVPQESPMADGVYSITAKTAMLGVPSAVSKPLSITIDATSPQFTSGDEALAIEENSGPDQVVYTAAITDETATHLSLQLGNGDDSSQFSLDSATGDVRLIVDPDFEANNTYSFVVEASDQAGNISVQPVTLSVRDRVETDLNLDGLLDGSGQTQILSRGGRVITIRDEQGRPKGDYKNAKVGYKLVKAVADESQHRILVEGVGSHRIGKFRLWNIDETGLITVKSDWQTSDDAVALGWEDYFGDIVNKDGFVGPAPAFDANSDGLVDGSNQSKIFNDSRSIQIKDKNGTPQGNFKNWKLGYQIVKASPSESGFDLLLKGNGKWTGGKFMLWNTNSDGLLTKRSGWKSADFAVGNGWEDRFGDIINEDGHVGFPPAQDDNADGLVDGIKQPLIYNPDSEAGIAIKNKAGRIQVNSSHKKTGYNVIKAVSTDQGFALLLKGKGSWTRNKFQQMTTNRNGVIKTKSGWKNPGLAVSEGWEDRFGDLIKPDGIIGLPAVADKNNDGLVDGTNQSQIFHNDAGISITNRRGRVLSNWKNRKLGYNIIKAVPEDDGYEVLLKGRGKKNRGRFSIWSTNESGVVTGNTGWKKIPFALKNDWESIFGDIILPNGIIG